MVNWPMNIGQIYLEILWMLSTEVVLKTSDIFYYVI